MIRDWCGPHSTCKARFAESLCQKAECLTMFALISVMGTVNL